MPSIQEPILIRREDQESIEYSIVKTLGRTKIRKIGNGIKSKTEIYAVGKDMDAPESDFGTKVSESKMAYGNTPYSMVTRRYES